MIQGCVGQQPVGVKNPRAWPIAASGSSQNCAFAVTAIDDQRDDKALGHLFGTTVSGDGFVDWISGGLAAIPGHSAGDVHVRLRVEILKAYLQMIGSSKSANLVVRVHTSVGGDAPQIMTYRGVDISPWNGMEVEIRRAMNRALSDLQLKLHADLTRACMR